MTRHARAATGIRPARHGGRPARGRWLVALLTVLTLAGGWWAARSFLRHGSARWQVRRGFELLANVGSAAEVAGVLDRWEAQLPERWKARPDRLIEYLCRQCPLDDRRTRLLLTRLSGADYGDRVADWQRWWEAQVRMAAGQLPAVPRGEAVHLEHRWAAPVGLSAWFTTILPLDGQVYVASLGTAFDDRADDADGVVRVDGTTGAAEYLFLPPSRAGRGPRDVVGIAAADEGLFVACFDGTVYLVGRDGTERWSTHVGGPIVGPPLSVDFSGDDVSDVIVCTEAGKVVALSGQTGRTAWVANVGSYPPAAGLLGAMLALGDVLPEQRGLELVVTFPPGDVRVLALRSGDVRWRHELSAGCVAGAICRGEPPEGLPAHLGDRAARVWTLVGGLDDLSAVPWGALALHADETLIAGLRTLQAPRGEPPVLLACPTGEYDGRRGAVCAVGPEGVRWRYPVGGAIWGTPAVADLNRDGEPEIVVAAIEPDAGGAVLGALTVLSAAGHPLAWHMFERALECSPVVADVDGDGGLEVLVADQSGLLHCFGTGRFGRVLWGLAGGDSHNTNNAANAFAWGQVPNGYQWRWRP